MKSEDNVPDTHSGMQIWKELSEEEEKEFRQWARNNFIPGLDTINSTWHPIVKEECKRMCKETLDNI